jgi:hypothetical protein
MLSSLTIAKSMSTSGKKKHFKDELGLVYAQAKPSRQLLLNFWRDSFI